MSLPNDSASRSAVRDASTASENSKPDSASRSLLNAAGSGSSGNSKPNLANSIQTLKELASKNVLSTQPATLNSLTGEPLAVAFEKRIQSLQGALKERDQVVQMLTQRLEQAADQLDRVQRSGGTRGGSTVASLPAELIENQQSLVEQLTRVLGEWEETQAGQTLSRIESQITELRELVASGANSFSSLGATASSASAFSTKKPADQPPKVSRNPTVIFDSRSIDSPKSSWEAIKAAMMAAEESTESPGTFAPKATEQVTKSVENTIVESIANESASANQFSAPQPLPEPPRDVDFDIADHATLVEAIHCRDEYISILLRRLKSPEASTAFPDWEKLNAVPEELHTELLALRDRLQDKLRVAEVDLSLKRAKLAREEAKLAIKAEHVARQMRQLGLSPDEPVPPSSNMVASSESPNANQGRRWLQFLQRSNGNGAGADGK